MRSATAVGLSVPSFVQLLVAMVGILRPHALVLLGPLMLVAFLCLVVAIGIASYQYEEPTMKRWKWVILAAVAQCLAFSSLAAQPLH